MRFGAIDIGTNSLHLLVVELDPYVGTTRTIVKAREMVRLGGGDALIAGRLGKKIIARGVEVIADFIAQAQAVGATEMRIVATSAVRDAENSAEFVSAVRLRTGMDVEILSGRDEAQLIHLGVGRGYPLDERLACIVDIGGGSTECIVADHQRTYYLTSLPLGSLRLYERFRKGEHVDQLALDVHIAEMLAPLGSVLSTGEVMPGGAALDIVIGTSGTWLGLAALDAAARGQQFKPRKGYVLELDRLRTLQKRLLSLSIADRKKMPGMNPRRSDIIVAGCAIAVGILEHLGQERVSVCDHALREGIVADYLQKNHDRVKAVGDERLRRLDAVRDLSASLGAEMIHENHVATLALSLFDSFRDPGVFDPGDRDLLFAAAVAHDIGYAVNRSGHHKHGAYILRNAPLPGWRVRERELLAQIVRYHRKGLPKPTHLEYMALEPSMRRRIEVLAAFLRIADGLDAQHLSLVSHAGFERNREAFVINLTTDTEIEPELQSARAKADLFARTFGAAPQFRVVMTGANELSQADFAGSVQ